MKSTEWLTCNAYGEFSNGEFMVPNERYTARMIGDPLILTNGTKEGEIYSSLEKEGRFRAVRNGNLYSLWVDRVNTHAYVLPTELLFKCN